MKLKNQLRVVVLLTAALGVVEVFSLSVFYHLPLYTTHTTLTTSYNTPFASQYWKTASFNNSQGQELAFFDFAFRQTNQSLGPVMTTMHFGPIAYQPMDLDSFKITFATVDGLSFPDVGLMISTPGFTPTQISNPDPGTVIISYTNLGVYGQGNEGIDTWFGFIIVNGARSTTHSLFLTVDITGHAPNPSLTAQSYSGEAIFKIDAAPNGLLSVDDIVF